MLFWGWWCCFASTDDVSLVVVMGMVMMGFFCWYFFSLVPGQNPIINHIIIIKSTFTALVSLNA